ncbi:hypothetical protein [Luteolibacter sp. Populi]|uniref:hypothetical protein n=1 Tax=Luteolibacter sp. Populi TaxID=3230487 RepID=UPI003465954A
MQNEETAASLRARITEAGEAGKEAFAAVGAIGELRAKVKGLERDSRESPTVEQCRTAARALVAATQDLQAAEIVEPMEKAAAVDASKKIREAQEGVCGSIARHFLKLGEEANAVALELAYALMDPSVRALSPYEAPGKRRDASASGITEFLPGVVTAWPLFHKANHTTTHHGITTAPPISGEMLETFDEDTARVRREIDRLKQILSFLRGDGDTAGGGGGDALGADPAEEPIPAGEPEPALAEIADEPITELEEALA